MHLKAFDIVYQLLYKDRCRKCTVDALFHVRLISVSVQQ